MKKILIIFIGLFVLCGCDKDKEQISKENENINVITKENIIKNQNVGDFEFTNTSMIEENGITTLNTTIKNTSNETKYVTVFKILIKDREGSVVKELIGYIGGEIKPNETKNVKTSVTSKLSDAYSIEYVIQ